MVQPEYAPDPAPATESLNSRPAAVPPQTAGSRGARPYAAERWFFPAAALYGAVAVPLSVYSMLSGRQWLPAFATPMGHAHELLFGYALAVAAGFLVNRIRAVPKAAGRWSARIGGAVPAARSSQRSERSDFGAHSAPYGWWRTRSPDRGQDFLGGTSARKPMKFHPEAVGLALLFGLWLAARVTYIAAPQGLAAAASNVAFATLLAGLVAPKLMQGAKKLRNKAFGPAIVALAVAVGAFHFALVSEQPAVAYVAVQEGVLLFTLLMLFMGGRILAPAVAAAIERAGGFPRARLQPRIEGALLGLMVAAVVSAALPAGRPLAGAALLLAGMLAAVRVWRWRLWQCRGRADLLCLGIGYAWLAVGLGLLGAAWLLGAIAASAALHGLTVGALGTLTASVMARVRMLRAKRDPATLRTLPYTVALIAVAAGVRIFLGQSQAGLYVAAACWSAALLLLAVALVRIGSR